MYKRQKKSGYKKNTYRDGCAKPKRNLVEIVTRCKKKKKHFSGVIHL